MKICLKCNNKVEDTKKFCDNCGGNAFRPLPKQPQQTQRPPQPNIRKTQQQQNIRQNQQIEETDTVDNKYTETDSSQEDMTVKQWIITLILTIIPIFNIVYIIKNIRNTNNPLYKRNYFKAYGLYFIVASVISLILSVVL